MPFVAAKCPQCGAQLKVNDEKDAAICEFCGTPFIVEKAIHNYTINNNYNGATIIQSEMADLTNLKKLASQALHDINFVQAKDYYDKILLQEPDNIEAYFYSKYCDIRSHVSEYPIHDIASFNTVSNNSISRLKNSDIDESQRYKSIKEIVEYCERLTEELDRKRVELERVELKKNKEAESLDPQGSIYTIVLSVADTLYENYPNDTPYKTIFIGLWKKYEGQLPTYYLRQAYTRKVKIYEPDYTSSYTDYKSGCIGVASIIVGIIFFLLDNCLLGGLSFLIGILLFICKRY